MEREDTELTTSRKTIRIDITDRKTSDNGGIIYEDHSVKFFTDEKEAMKFWYAECHKHYWIEKTVIDTMTTIFINEKYNCHKKR